MKKITLLFLLLGAFCTTKAQTVSTGTLSLQPSINFTGQIDVDDTNVTITLVGPANVWLGLGFGLNTMTSGGDVITHDASGFNDRQFLGVGVTPSTDTQDWTVSSNNVTAGVRTLVVTRGLVGSDSTDFSFDNTATNISLVWASGNNTDTFNNHGGINRGALVAPLNAVLGVNDASLSNNLFVFPVPAADLITVSVGSFAFEKGFVSIYSMLGEMLHHQMIEEKSSLIDISTLSEGIYLLTISTDNGSAVTRIIKN
jgi:hypothetical protein